MQGGAGAVVRPQLVAGGEWAVGGGIDPIFGTGGLESDAAADVAYVALLG